MQSPFHLLVDLGKLSTYLTKNIVLSIRVNTAKKERES